MKELFGWKVRQEVTGSLGEPSRLSQDGTEVRRRLRAQNSRHKVVSTSRHELLDSSFGSRVLADGDTGVGLPERGARLRRRLARSGERPLRQDSSQKDLQYATHGCMRDQDKECRSSPGRRNVIVLPRLRADRTREERVCEPTGGLEQFCFRHPSSGTTIRAASRWRRGSQGCPRARTTATGPSRPSRQEKETAERKDRDPGRQSSGEERLAEESVLARILRVRVEQT